MSASTPLSAKYCLVSSGYSVETRTPAGRSATDWYSESSGTATTTVIGLVVALEYLQLAQRGDLGAGLLDPVPAGDAQVEQAVGHIRGYLLGPQDPHGLDPGIVDVGLVRHGGVTLDGQVGGLEQVQRGPFE